MRGRLRPRATATGWLAATLGMLTMAVGCGTPAQSVEGSSADLDRLRVVTARPDLPGYSRSCRPGAGCSFGEAWTDRVSVELGGHDGCDQRSPVLRRDLHHIAIKPGTRGCVVVSGILEDPYTGATVNYRRGASPQPVVVDHVYSLSAAWDLGAAYWDLQRRMDFAGDPRNLITTTRAANLSKGDKTPGDWLPRRGRCRFANAFISVAETYDLPVTGADKRVLRRAIRDC